ncbi:MAG: immunoglobulin domain-containing protein [Limisphaerales bacterium]
MFRVAFDPRIVGPPTNAFVTAGATVNFNVRAAGTGPLLYQWLFNSSPLPGQTNTTLVLNNVSTNQAGAYSVVIFGSAGSLTNQTAYLAVVGPPVFDSVKRLANGGVTLVLRGAPLATDFGCLEGRVLFASSCLFPGIPTGFHHPAQGCEERATLGQPRRDAINPERVVSRQAGAMMLDCKQTRDPGLACSRKVSRPTQEKSHTGCQNTKHIRLRLGQTQGSPESRDRS